MKLRTISFMMLLLCLTHTIQAQQTDPALTAAVVAQTKLLSDLYKKRDKHSKKLLLQKQQ